MYVNHPSGGRAHLIKLVREERQKLGGLCSNLNAGGNGNFSGKLMNIGGWLGK